MVTVKLLSTLSILLIPRQPAPYICLPSQTPYANHHMPSLDQRLASSLVQLQHLICIWIWSALATGNAIGSHDVLYTYGAPGLST